MVFQWYVNCINLLVNLILPTTLLGILNYFVYKVLNRNQVSINIYWLLAWHNVTKQLDYEKYLSLQ
jgi:uncharacterized membrane protein